LNPFEVLLFASARDLSGCGSLRIDLNEGATVAQLSVALAQRYPVLAALLTKCRIAVNHEFAEGERILQLGDELAVIPPVSGG